ncbi:MAG: ACT domain-containing protein [Desulfuromonadales bacterium]
MNKRFILTAFGKNRPGIAADVTRILYENGCNLEDNSMTRLADEFTLILLLTCPDAETVEQLQKECRRLEMDKGISAFMRPVGERQETDQTPPADCSLQVEGMDQAGIVYRISQHLADKNVDIVDLKSSVKASPGSGTAIYLMDIDVQLPEGMTPDSLENSLSAVADELSVDISISGGSK